MSRLNEPPIDWPTPQHASLFAMPQSSAAPVPPDWQLSGVVQTLFMQTPPRQSVPSTQALVSAQARHVPPPQSAAVSTPFILMSAYGGRGAQQRARDLRAVMFLRKPFSLFELRDAVRAILDPEWW